MKLRPGVLVLAVCAAVVLHLALVLAAKSLPLIGSGRLARAASEILDDPEIATVSARDPVRVTLGVTERGTASRPGTRAVLDPLSVRRAPGLGAEWPDAEARLATARELFMPPPEVPLRSPRAEGTSPLRCSPPEGGVPPFRSWAEREVADVAIALGAKVVTRRLPRRFLTRPTLARAAKAARRDIVPLEKKLDFPSPPALPEKAPDWKEPERAIPPPEVFVDVLEARR